MKIAVNTLIHLIISPEIMKPEPQFKMKIKFHFKKHGKDRRNWFLFGDDLERRVPMKMEGVEGSNTVGMYIEKETKFYRGDGCEVDCIVIAPELFKDNIQSRSKGKFRTTDVS